MLVAMHRVVPPYREARDDHAIFAELAQCLGIVERFTESRSARQWLRHLYEMTLKGGDLRPKRLPHRASAVVRVTRCATRGRVILYPVARCRRS
jgi:anaerobic selenocysteine-containing dehydrogenase